MTSHPPETPRARPSLPGLVSPPSRRPAFSPLSTLSSAASPAHSFRTSTYQSSVRAPESVSGYSLAPSRFTTRFSASASQAGSVATTANPAGPAKFRRGHVRKRPGQPSQPPVQQTRTANPDEVDLMALEEPDEVFRLFGVRDVRRIEQRASDAAAAKVAELRTMVGERYRDLLAAADSIVRMRSAAEKLVDRLDAVDQAVGAAGAAVEGTPSKRGKTPRLPARSTNPPGEQRTLASSATLSLTIHLLLTIPSLVHSLLETSDFLPAARLEDLGHLVYRELSDFELPPADGDEDGEARRLKDAFPIVEKQWETLSTLRPVVLRRALGELQTWDAPPINTAQTLAATAMLQGASLSTALSTFLDARSKALSDILAAPSTSSQTFESSDVSRKLEQVLGLILRTVEAVSAIFGNDASPGLLQQLIAEVEHPSATSAETAEAPALPPVLATFPNYTTLQRHLPPSILAYSPSAATSASREPLAASIIAQQFDAWLATESDRLVAGVTSWIAALSSPTSPAGVASAKPLALLRTTLRHTVSTATAPSSAAASTLRTRLELAIEARLAAVYRSRLALLAARVRPALEALLLALPGSDSLADRDAAAFWFETPLAFPAAGAYARAASGAAGAEKVGATDPLEAFLAKVGKRVEGRAPLLDRGLGELEDAARELRADLESWLGGAEDGEERELRERLRAEYGGAAGETLAGVADALEGVLTDVADDVDGALFVGNFAFLLSSSRTFTRDLLLGSASPADASLLNEWQSRLAALQERSLAAWQEQAVTLAVRKLHESMSAVAAASPSATVWAWDASRAETPSSPLVPSSPSSALLSALRSLSSSLSRVGLHRTQASPSIAASLLDAFAREVRSVAGEFAAQLEKGELADEERAGEVACQAAWDLALLRRLAVGGGEGDEEQARAWTEVEGRFLRLVSPPSDTLPTQLSASAISYLQRTQSILALLLPHPPPFYASPPASSSETAAAGGAKPKPLSSAARLLPLGQPQAGADVKATGVGLVRPGPRLGLLPTRG
ncbi:hypothetical protein JCM10449v2_001874 [Rhodotorula kratochvilovae]